MQRHGNAARQVGEDGSIKLAQRALPLLIANARAGRPTARLAALVHAWITCAARGMIKDPQSAHLQSWSRAGGTLADLLADPNIFPNEFRTDPIVRMAIGQPHTLLTQTLRGSNA